jgi:ketosteroid isomerase-like protein
MRIRWCVAVVAILATGSALARDAAQDERSIRHAETAICDAYEAGDGDSLANRLTDDFTLTDSKGIVTGRDKNVHEVASRDPAYLMFRNHDQKVRLYGDAAVVTGITSLQGHTANATFAGDYAYTDTWVYVDRRWKLAASHASLLRTR